MTRILEGKDRYGNQNVRSGSDSSLSYHMHMKVHPLTAKIVKHLYHLFSLSVCITR